MDWLKKILGMPLKKEAVALGNCSNKYYIEKYKDFDKVIATQYQKKDSNGIAVDIDGIVTPLKIDNRQLCSVTDDQGTTSMCAAYSICNLCEALIWKKTGKLINLNAEQVYALAKQLDGEVNSDGTYLECAIKAAMQLGGFGSQSSNLDIGFLYNSKRDDSIVEQMKRLVHKHDFVHAGFAIDDGWYRATNDNYVIEEGKVNYGGHAVLVVGYDKNGVYIQNSWSKAWGSKGFAILPWRLVKKQLIYCCVVQNFVV